MVKPTMLRNTVFSISIISLRTFLIIITRLITCPSLLQKGWEEEKNRKDKWEGRRGLMNPDTLGAADRKSCPKEEEGANRPLAGLQKVRKGKC